MLVAELLGRRTRPEKKLGLREAVAIGGAQGARPDPRRAAIGFYDFCGPCCGYTREAAARTAAPAVDPRGRVVRRVRAARHRQGRRTRRGRDGDRHRVAFAVGYVTIAWLLRWLTSHSTAVFVAYRAAIGAFVFLLLVVGTMSAT